MTYFFKLFVILSSLLIILSCKKGDENIKNDNLKTDKKKEIKLSGVSKIEKLKDVIYIFGQEELYSFKENDTISEKVIFQDSLVPRDIMVHNDKLFVLGVVKYRLKLISGSLNNWEEISLPTYIQNDFIDTILKRYKIATRNEPYLNKKYDIYNPIEPDNYRKFYNFYNLLMFNIYLIGDKTFSLITQDSLYFYSNDKWNPMYLPKIGYNYDAIYVEGIGHIRALKDSILYYGLNFGEWGGYIASLDLRKENKKWNILNNSVNVSQIIPGKSKNSFYYSTNLAHMGGREGKLFYYDSDSKKLLYSFNSKEYINEFRLEESRLLKSKGIIETGTVVRDIQKLNDKIFILTEQGIFLYEKNEMKKLINDDGDFDTFYVDDSENIYVFTDQNILTKYRKTDTGYTSSKISFYKSD